MMGVRVTWCWVMEACDLMEGTRIERREAVKDIVNHPSRTSSIMYESSASSSAHASRESDERRGAL